jgi:hypothetical protein
MIGLPLWFELVAELGGSGAVHRPIAANLLGPFLARAGHDAISCGLASAGLRLLGGVSMYSV